MQVAEAVVPDRVQVVNDPVTPVSLRATVPVGVRNVPAVDVSVTVTVQVEAVFTTTGLVQLTAVLVVRGLTTTLVVPLLELNEPVTPGYEAVIAAVPEVVGVKVEVHVAEAVVPDRVQVVNDPVTPVSDRETVPVGVVAPVVDVSVTVTVHVEPWFATTGVAQDTVVVVGWTPVCTMTLVVPLLAE